MHFKRKRKMTDVADRVESGLAAPARVVPATLFMLTVFVSAALVFIVEPMMARLVLPLLGGSAAVWNTSLAVFQAALLAGYVYAHLLQRLRRIGLQIGLHLAVLIAAGLTLPLRVTGLFGEPSSNQPALWLVGVLVVSIGAPFAALSATAPLVQAWHARAVRHEGAREPYVLYAASNLGSLIALIAYPAVVEPSLRLHTQTAAWTAGYGVFIVLAAILGAEVSRAAHGLGQANAPIESASAAPAAWRERLTWLALAAIPSSLILGVTSHITMDIASAPFLWVVPLALYLVTFIIAFQARPLIAPRQALLFQAAAALLCFLTLGLTINVLPLLLLVHLAGFFLTALVCHQALAARRPAPNRLTEFYLFMSLGGVTGGSFNAFVAPVIFKSVVEYPLVLALACLARPWGRGGLTLGQIALLIAGLCGAGGVFIVNTSQGLNLAVKLLLVAPTAAAFLLRDRAWVFLTLSVVVTLSSNQLVSRPNLLDIERGFFGVLRMNRIYVPGLGNTRELIHGTTLHGAQADDPALRCTPLVYFSKNTPIGQVFTSLQARKSSIRIGTIGMGAGTVATYTRATDSMRFFEIDPLIVKMATDPAEFTYIKGCAKGRIDWVLGDARLTLAREPANDFDLLLVDAFSSDSVPAHLLTVEAMRSYLARIKPDGVVVMHLSNRNLELMSPVAGVAKAAGGVALQQAYRPRNADLVVDPSEDAVIVAKSAAALAPYQHDPRWTPAQSHGVRIWTDDYTNLFGALLRRFEHPAV
jgi:hypothetical protein